MTDPFDAKVFPLVLLGAMWAAFNLFLKSFEMMNKARDKIISPTNGLTRCAREHILLAEYRILRIATFLFVLAFASFLIWVPFAMPSFDRSVLIACGLVAIISVVFSFGLIIFCGGDMKRLRVIIDRQAQLESAANLRPNHVDAPPLREGEADRR